MILTYSGKFSRRVRAPSYTCIQCDWYHTSSLYGVTFLNTATYIKTFPRSLILVHVCQI